MKNVMKKVMKKVINKCLYLILFLNYQLSWADLPRPPADDIANGSQDWIDIGKTLLFKLIGYAAITGGAIILVGIAMNIYSAYQVAQERQDLGHFFKHLMTGLLVATIVIGLLYFGYSIVAN